MPLLAQAYNQLTALRAPPAATLELDGTRYAAPCHELERTVLAYLRKGWQIEGTRCFLMQPDVTWNSMEKFLNSELAPQGGARERFEWHDPGHDLVAVWKVGSADYIATAMAHEEVDGRPLVGYFAVRKEK
jgi:hypothetical protein